MAVTNEFVLARGAANRDQQCYSLKEPPAIRFYPQRLPTTHVPSQDNHAAGVREVSEHTVCLVFHSQVTGHCTNSSSRTIAAQTLLMDLFHRIRLVNSPANDVQYEQCWHSTLCLASARDTPYLGRYSMTACYDCFNEVIEPTVNGNDF